VRPRPRPDAQGNPDFRLSISTIVAHLCYGRQGVKRGVVRRCVG
jgi:hypothetical protein